MKKIIFILFLLFSGPGFSADDESGAGKGKGESNVFPLFQNTTTIMDFDFSTLQTNSSLVEIEAFVLELKLSLILDETFDLNKIIALQNSEEEVRESLLIDSKATQVNNKALPSPQVIYQQLLNQGITHKEVKKYSLVNLSASIQLFLAWRKEADQKESTRERRDLTALLFEQIQDSKDKLSTKLKVHDFVSDSEFLVYEIIALRSQRANSGNITNRIHEEQKGRENIVDIDFKNNPRNPANEILTEWFGDSIAEDLEHLDKLEVLKKYYSMDDIRSLQSSEAEVARRLIVNENTGHSSKSSKILQFYYAYIDKGLDHDDISMYGLISLAAIVDLFIQLDQRHQNHSLDKQGYKDLRDTIMYVDVTIREFVESGEERFLEYAGVNSPRLLESIVDYRGVKAADRKQEIDRLAAEISQGGSCNSFF